MASAPVQPHMPVASSGAHGVPSRLWPQEGARCSSPCTQLFSPPARLPQGAGALGGPPVPLSADPHLVCPRPCSCRCTCSCPDRNKWGVREGLDYTPSLLPHLHHATVGRFRKDFGCVHVRVHAHAGVEKKRGGGGAHLLWPQED